TDFGLAGFVEDSSGKDVAAGTPAYMAPEQLAGREVSVKSDVYSLGLVLFELFAGKRLFEGATREQIDRLQSVTTPTTLSGLAEDIDPAVERVIQRCLEIEPSARPSSALAVAAALPGGDPLAAALAAGETPDPEMVAAAGEAGGLRPTIAWAWLATLLGALILGTLVSDRAFLHQREALEKPPQVLADRASNLIRKLGYTDPPQDSAHGFIREPDYMRYVRGQARSPDRQDNVALGGPQPISFWYRQSPHLLVAVKHIASTGDWSRGAVSADDPPPSLSGMVAVRLDPRGRLLQFRAVPTQVDKIEHQAEGPDWLALFAEAGLDMARFEPVTSTWTPPVFADTRAAWKGSYSEDSEIPIRVEAAACRGKPVYFHVLGPWTRPERDEPFAGDVGSGVAATTWSVIWLAVVIGAAVLGVRNLRLGRADRRGAAKLAVYVLSLSVLTWLFKASHVPDFSREQHLFTMGLAVALQSAIRYCFYYLALEPYARKLWPQSLIAWSRVLAGRFRDPLVGRDLLIGGVFGVSWWLLLLFVFLVASWLGSPPPQPPAPKLLNTLLGGRYVAAVFLENGVTAVFTGLAALMLFLLLRVVLRRQWLAIVVFLSVFTVVNALPANHYALWLGWALVNASFLFLLLRFGLFAAVAGIFVSSFFATFPVTFDFSAWYIGASLTALVAALALGVYGFHTALAGRPLVEDRLLEA
ncbi:MAG: protein kinase, partial [Phycisphaerales bacterium]